MELIAEVPPIEVDGRVAACDGGEHRNIIYALKCLICGVQVVDHWVTRECLSI